MTPSSQWAVPILALVLAGAPGCGPDGKPAALSQEQVCAVTGTSFITPRLDNAQAWDWPPEAAKAVASQRWTEVDKALLGRCSSGAVPVVALSFSRDGSHAQVTHSTMDFSDSGSVVTCLLRREPEMWRLVGCKLDAVA